MTIGIRSTVVAVVALVAISVAGCGSRNGQAKFQEKLTGAGFDHVSVTRDEEGSGSKKALVAYDVDWPANTDGDDATCTVELEHPANKNGSLKGGDWHIDEVNGQDVNGWGGDSPNPATVRQLLQEHGFDC
ncbi:hypothetical protein ACFQ1L_15435 [Phytohabitans flavus]|nr:hypothetical protein [Phytohabitans flavus]